METLSQRLCRLLESAARQHQTITYRALAEQADIPAPQSIRRLTELLETMIRSDHDQGINPSLACLAVSQTNPAIPRAGYFMLLNELGLYQGANEGNEAEAFHQQQLQQLFERYSAS